MKAGLLPSRTSYSPLSPLGRCPSLYPSALHSTSSPFIFLPTPPCFAHICFLQKKPQRAGGRWGGGVRAGSAVLAGQRREGVPPSVRRSLPAGGEISSTTPLRLGESSVADFQFTRVKTALRRLDCAHQAERSWGGGSARGADLRLRVTQDRSCFGIWTCTGVSYVSPGLGHLPSELTGTHS